MRCDAFPLRLLCLSLGGLSLACSGEDDPNGGNGAGIGSGASAGAGGNGSLGVGGRAGQGGKGGATPAGGAGGQGPAGQAGKAGTGGSAGQAGGSSGTGGAGQSGAAGESGSGGLAGSAGSGGTAGGGQGGTANRCGNGLLDPGERCDGALLAGATCSGLLNDPSAGGTVTCNGCMPDTSACTSCLDGRKSPGEGDIDCGGKCAPCTLGMTCQADADCLLPLQCFGGVCHAANVLSSPTDVHPSTTTPARVPVILKSTLPLPKSAKVTLATPVKGITLLPANATVGDDLRLAVAHDTVTDQEIHIAIDGVPLTDFYKLGVHPRTGPATNETPSYAARVGSCVGLPGTPIPHSGVLTLPTHTPLCLAFNIPATDSRMLEEVRIGDVQGTPTFSGGETFSMSVNLGPELYDRAPAYVLADLQLNFGGAWHIHPDAIRISALTVAEGGKGVGLIGSPADAALVFANIAAYQAPATIQVAGDLTLPMIGLVVPPGVTLQSADATQRSILTSGGGDATKVLVDLQGGAKLHDVKIQGTSGANHCVRAQGMTDPVELRDVGLDLCNTGVQAMGSVTVSGSGCVITKSQQGITASQSPDVTVVGCVVDVASGSGLALLGQSGITATQSLKAVRPTVAALSGALTAVQGGDLTAIAPALLVQSDAGGPSDGARLTVLGGKVSTPSGASSGARGFVVDEFKAASSELRVAGTSFSSLGRGAIVAVNGTADLLNVDVLACGTPDNPAAPAIAMRGATGRFDEVRIVGSLGDGIALSGGKLDAYGVTVDTSGGRGLFVTGGTLLGRGLFGRGALGAVLAVADGGVLDIHDSAFVAPNKRTMDAPLIASLRTAPAMPEDDLVNVTLQAGEGQALTTKSPANAICGTLLDGFEGGIYISTANPAGTFCF